ncbi:glucodextranase DOMON-like domain-containing protein [Natronoarchaeum rubrum]|uniref:glucodextranase DOMON-like domain-containing protein n=1 Tax=Natronoarchaeum rubrum TaxID=755311 RepID=UPI0021123BB8|nr:glucodextranase DOMON-like domain-containing protein [Natronoarchaeum rubrum]
MDRRQYLSGLAAASALAVTGVSTASAQSDAIASWDDATGDANGPGSYTRPTGDNYSDATWDISSFSIHSADGNYQFKLTVDGTISNNFPLENGFSHQHIQVYLRDPSASSGASAAREGVNANLAANYQIRILVDGQNGVRVQDAEGSELATGTPSVEGDSTIVFSVSQDTIGDIESMHVAPLMLGFDGFGPGQVRTVESEASQHKFGGEENENASNVIDLITPDGTSQSDALAYSSDSVATIPYLSVSGDSSGGGSSDGGSSDDGSSDDGSSDDGSSDDGSSDDGSSDDGSSDDGSSDDGSSDDGGSDGDSSDGGSSDDSGSDDGSSSDEDSGLPGFGIGVGLLGAAGGALAARRRGEADDDEA